MSAGEFPVFWIAGSLTERTWTSLRSARRSACPYENAEASKSTTKGRSNLSLDVQITLWRRFEGEPLASFTFYALLASIESVLVAMYSTIISNLRADYAHQVGRSTAWAPGSTTAEERLEGGAQH